MKKKYVTEIESTFTYLVLLFLILFATNPRQSAFEDYLKNDLKKKVAMNVTGEPSNLFTGIATDILLSEAPEGLGNFITQDDLFVFSFFSIDTPENEFSISYIGVANHFIKIKTSYIESIKN